MKKNKFIQKYRNIFIEKLNKKFDQKITYLKTIDTINRYTNTFDLNNKINFVNKAHIIPVFYLLKNKRYKDIKNSNNGLILDSNTHRIFDQDKNAKLSKDYSIISNNFFNLILIKYF